jgi:(2Fe-2S) ferredoxin
MDFENILFCEYLRCMRFEKHIFICANDKAPGKACCGMEHGLALVAKFRDILKEKGLNGNIRAQRSGCLDACSKGPSLVIYPEGTYYGNVELIVVERIIDQHILQGKEVEDLVLAY